MRIVQLGSRCNNACVFCAQAVEREHDFPEPSVEALTASVDVGVQRGDSVAFVGGEPTLYDCLTDLVTRVRSRAAGRVIVQTNARRCSYGGYARKLASCGVEVLDVTLLGASEAMHDYHTQASGSYAQTIRGMANARRAGMDVLATVVVTRSNYRNLPEIVRVAKATGALAIRFRAPRLSGSALRWSRRVVPHFELVTPYLRAAVQAGGRHGIEVVAGRLATSVVDFVDFISDQVEVSGLGVVGEQAPMVGTCRAQPGRSEQRDRNRRTGAELREILPLFFEPTGEGC